MWAARIVPALFAATLPGEAPAGAGAHIAAAGARTAVAVAARTAAAAEQVERRAAEGIAASHTAGAEARIAAVAALVEKGAARLALPVWEPHTLPEVVATAPHTNQVRPASVVEARRPHKPRPPSPVRRRKGSLFSREERRVRIADISS
jgi:hypothetical protein